VVTGNVVLKWARKDTGHKTAETGQKNTKYNNKNGDVISTQEISL
jgi:hypothetical protein